MKKEFLQYNTVRNNAMKLAKKIYDDGFQPDVIYVPLRGGAYMGNVFSEFFKLVNIRNRPVFYAAVVARSYSNIYHGQKVQLDGWTYSPEFLRNGDRILFVDDIFDTGRTMNYLVECILEKGIPREDIKIAVHDYKITSFREHLSIKPDYACRELEITRPEDDVWIHYLSHELEGLSEEEIHHYYLQSDPELAEVFDFIHSFE